jgi:tRNA(fMet)-specific endonuclease VapC
VSVIVDTSVWVDYFRGSGATELDGLLDAGLVFLAPIVAAELLSAPLTRRERTAMVDLLEDLPLHPTPLAHWRSVGELRAELRRVGLSVSTPDAHVAQCALDCDGGLWSHDVVFRQLAKKTGLRLFDPRT